MTTPQKESEQQPVESPKIGRSTLALILGHLEKRETQSDNMAQKQASKMWMLSVLLVFGLLATVGVAGAVKFYGMDATFSPAEVPEKKAPAN